MPSVFSSFFKALWSQLHIRMLLLTLLPFLLSVAIWGLALWLGLQPLMDWIHASFLDNDGFRFIGGVLGWFGFGAIKTMIVPMVAMWALLPLMILTALIFIATLAMPAIINHVSKRDYPMLERRHGGSMMGLLWISLTSFIIFVALSLLSLPLLLVPPLGLFIHPLLWGWLTYRVLAYDALAAHADKIELHAILHRQKWPLLLIGAITGAIGAAPTTLWLGGAMSVILFPFLAALSIWLYVLVFVFTGLWFQHYCLAALQAQRAS